MSKQSIADRLLSVASRAMPVFLALDFSGAALAQDYPSRPIRVITTAAGGGGDFASRVVGEGISGPLGQPVIVDNRTGVIPGEIVAKAPPDGHTLAVVGGAFWIAPLLRKTPYDTQRDFSYVSILVAEVSLLVVGANVPVKSVKELIALAKAKPGALNYGTSSGAGGTGHLAGELFKSMAGVNIVWVPYKAATEAVSALLNGEVQMMVTDAGGVAPMVKAGKLRALAVTSLQPSALAPGLPTVTATGLPGYEVVNRTSIVAPAKTPAAIVGRLNREIVRVLNQPEVRTRFLNIGAETVGSTPEEFATIIKAYIETWGKVIKDAGIKAE
jgi:tripartite-type tricarboxylate transporter receptor subunit TctC